MMNRAAAFLALALLAACSSGPAPEGRLAGAAPGSSREAVVAACRARALEVIGRQDRSQLIREDERDARLGSDTVGARAPIDRLGRQVAFDRMVQDCVRNSPQPGPAAPTGAAPTPPPTAPAGRSSR
jgi:hypothetical protein